MKVCITEKPSVARDIASLLGARNRKDGYFEGNGYCVTWTFGHLCTLKDPADYTERWKRWDLYSLPMIPPKFGIKLIDNDSYIKQFKVIENLVSTASEVINCGDAGQEGELIQRWVLQKADVKCPVKRLWISSLTDAAIRDGFQNLRDSAEFDNLYYAGLSRAIGDWLLGLNGTRLYSLKYSDPGITLSVGRVQTPTLAMIVERHREIENFKPQDYWELKTVYRDVTFNATPAVKYSSLEKGKEVLEKIKPFLLVIDDISEKTGRESAPRLFDLTSLQVECNSRFGWSADETLKLIQSLYEKKLTTYPRVDTTYLSSDLYTRIPEILKNMVHYSELTDEILKGKIEKSKKIFDDSKVTDHHAIIPTGESPKKLTDQRERQLYHLIALRFIANFYPECRFTTTTVLASAEEQQFRATGKVIKDPGWRIVLGNSSNEEKKEDETVLPEFTKGESGPHRPKLQKKTTTPPKDFTEGTLLKAMESAGKNVDDETLREAMKENGIGRPSTRSSIIETLIKRGYVKRNRKKIQATPAGIALIDTISNELLKSPKLTGMWENKLRRIERGEYSPKEFIDELKTQLNEIIVGVRNDRSGVKIEAKQK
ncbi:MAG: DNA topoisomerase 3 [Muribaculaceae bacterium]|nr:DNA topoisomerase 3 [Muribaculaceae bacterium]